MWLSMASGFAESQVLSFIGGAPYFSGTQMNVAVQSGVSYSFIYGLGGPRNDPWMDPVWVAGGDYWCTSGATPTYTYNPGTGLTTFDGVR